MPSEKEVEEAIRGLADPESDYRFKSGYCIYLFRDAYLSMKAERDQFQRMLAEQGLRNGRLVEERDKLKAIVDVDTEMLNLADSFVYNYPGMAKDYIGKALAMRDKE